MIPLEIKLCLRYERPVIDLWFFVKNPEICYDYSILSESFEGA